MEFFDHLDAVPRIRGTFLDFGADHRNVQRWRSASAPPSPKATLILNSQTHYVDALLERTLSLRLSSPQNSPKANQCAGDKEEFVCICGEPLLHDANFCHSCGYWHNKARGNDLKSMSVNLAKADLGTILGDSESDSLETLSSVAPHMQESLERASTIDSLASWEDDSNSNTRTSGHGRGNTRKRGKAARSACEKSQANSTVQLSRPTAKKQAVAQDKIVRNADLHVLQGDESVCRKTSQEGEPITTLMVCDIPCSKSIEDLLELVNSFGFEGTYDFAYMPSRRHGPSKDTVGNLGYAFVNFKKADTASSFMEVFQNISFPASLTKKLSYAKAARHQGYEANVGMHISRARRPGSMVTFS